MIYLYQMLGITKQAHFKDRVRLAGKQLAAQRALTASASIRKSHPMMGCRKMYHMVGDDLPIGRDRFERILLEHGFRVRFPRNYVKTTRPVKGRYFDNLIQGLKLTGINQLWQSDIAYIKVGGGHCYLVFIVDVYSRRIIGYQAHPHMLARANIKALKQALKLRGVDRLPGLIHHSDRGGQFIDKDYLKALRKAGITSSMAKHCWENAYAERVNGIAKNEYLRRMDLTSLRQLRTKLKRVVFLYNNERPHDSLPGKRTPVDYEKCLQNASIIPKQMTIYDPELSTYQQLSTKEKRSKKEKSTSSTLNNK